MSADNEKVTFEGDFFVGACTAKLQWSEVVRAAGVGPALTAWKAAVIPLDHARNWRI